VFKLNQKVLQVPEDMKADTILYEVKKFSYFKAYNYDK
jgi:hypothetical protein